MNLNRIAAGVVSAVNPLERLQIRISTSYTIGAGGVRTPTYAPAISVLGQVQALTFRDLTQTEGLNLQGIQRGIYINGRIDGLVRENKKGGDLITTPNGDLWLVTLVLEYWPDWTKVAVTLQEPGP